MTLTVLGILAVIVGILCLIVYFRSIIRVMLINRREQDGIEIFARRVAVFIVHRLAGDGRDYARVQWAQAWSMPLFLFICVACWFLLVQFAFSLILLGFRIEPFWPRAFSSSGSALSTLGFLTPPSLAGQYLAIFEAAIGLAVVILLFTFVPGYQAAIQARERKVGWLYARTGPRPTSFSLLESLHRSGHLKPGSGVWEDWESWFRGLLETHSTTPILAFVPAIYRDTTWLGAASAVLDSTSLLVASLDPRQTESARICREIGTAAMQTIAAELTLREPGTVASGPDRSFALMESFDHLYERLAALGLPVIEDKDGCRERFIAMRAEYEPSIRLISKKTLMAVNEASVWPHAEFTPSGN